MSHHRSAHPNPQGLGWADRGDWGGPIAVLTPDHCHDSYVVRQVSARVYTHVYSHGYTHVYTHGHLRGSTHVDTRFRSNRFLHIDCDLFESAMLIFDTLGDR